MSKADVENRLARAVRGCDKTSFDAICGADAPKMREHDYITRQDTGRAAPRIARSPILRYAAVACVVVLLLAGGFVWYGNEYTPCGVIAIDANPSVELTVSRSGRVIEVDAANRDARELIAGRDYEGLSLENAMSSMFGAMYAKGYLSGTEEDVILLSVTSENEERAVELTKTAMAGAFNALNSAGKKVVVLGQSFRAPSENTDVIAKYDARSAKALYAACYPIGGVSDDICELAADAVEQANAGGNLYEFCGMG